MNKMMNCRISASDKEGIATVLGVTVMLDSLTAAACDNNHAKQRVKWCDASVVVAAAVVA
jgi:hypothetical protein